MFPIGRLDLNENSDSDLTDNGLSSSDRTSIGKHFLLQHLSSNVSKIQETLPQIKHDNLELVFPCHRRSRKSHASELLHMKSLIDG